MPLDLIPGRRFLVGLATALTSLALAHVASAKTVGIVPPANPRTNCTAGGTRFDWTLTSIDRCRGVEGVGPLILPGNWASLTVPQQTLVLIDLERVNRGLSPVVGLSPSITSLATAGADPGGDPGFPASGFVLAGSIWADAANLIEADFGWMYYDGWGKTVVNLDCGSAHARGCWGHRDNILMDGRGSRLPPIVGGGGYKHGNPYNSFAFEMLAGYSQQHLSFTWASELRHFKHRPKLEPLRKPAITVITPRSGTAGGGTRVTVRGSSLRSVTAIRFGSAEGTKLDCGSDSSCTVRTPAHVAGSVSVRAVNAAGQSRLTARTRFNFSG